MRERVSNRLAFVIIKAIQCVMSRIECSAQEVCGMPKHIQMPHVENMEALIAPVFLVTADTYRHNKGAPLCDAPSLRWLDRGCYAMLFFFTRCTVLSWHPIFSAMSLGLIPFFES